jgi:hypothetical protein
MRVGSLLAAVAAVCVCLLPAHASISAPQTIGFMGLLNDPSGAHLNGDFDVTLTLYDTDTGGAALWSEPQTVHATNGLFSTALGKSVVFPTSLDFSRPYFVGITVGTDAEMQPRIPLQWVPYAMFAQNVAFNPSLLNKVSGGAMSSDGTKIGVETASPGTTLDVNGRVTVRGGTIQRGGSPISGMSDLGLYSLDPGWMRLVTNGSPIQFFTDSMDGTAFIPGADSMAMTIQPNGNVGIGTGSPAAKLDVNGSERLGSGGELLFADKGQIRSMDNNHRILFRRDENKMELREYGDIIVSSGASAAQETDALVAKANGNVGIGTASPGAKLDVRGGILMDDGSINATGSREKLRIVRGRVNPNGSINTGSGFTVNKVAPGRYQIIYTPAFTGNPVVVASAVETYPNPPNITNEEAGTSDANGIVIQTWDIQVNGSLSQGNLSDHPFDFVAIGPR